MNQPRVKEIQKILTNQDVYLVTLPSDLYYLTGFDLNGYWLFVTRTDCVFLTTRMLEYQIKDIFCVSQVIAAESNKEAYLEALKRFEPKKVYFSSGISLAVYNNIKRYETVLIESDLLSRMRAVKSEDEIKIIRENQKITLEAILCVKKLLKNGVTERFIQSKILRYFLDRGVSPAFEPIVAFGKNSAYPHHISSDARLNKNDLVLVDAGCRRNGYASDLTKIFFLGKINNHIKTVYNIVKKSQENAIKITRSGISCREVDTAARGYIGKYGFKDNFVHGVGHGLGLDVHEKPTLSQKSSDKLLEGMVITIEPGIYIPGKFGIRIEDTVLVTKNGCVNLTK